MPICASKDGSCTHFCFARSDRIFGIPIGVLGAGLEKIIEEENQDNTEEMESTTRDINGVEEELGALLNVLPTNL